MEMSLPRTVEEHRLTRCFFCRLDSIAFGIADLVGHFGAEMENTMNEKGCDCGINVKTIPLLLSMSCVLLSWDTPVFHSWRLVFARALIGKKLLEGWQIYYILFIGFLWVHARKWKALQIAANINKFLIDR